MVYETFLNLVTSRLQQEIGDGTELFIRKIPKNNGIILDALCIRTGDEASSPAIYLNSYFEQYEQGMPMDAIIQDILALYRTTALPDSILSAEFSNLEHFRPKIMFKLIHAATNRELLKTIPHIPYLDLAVIFYLHLEHSVNGLLTAVIHKDHMELWGLNTRELWQIALANTPKTFPAEIRSMTELMKEIAQENLGEQYDEETLDTLLEEEEVAPLYVLTNTSGLNGAGCMLYRNILKDFADSIGSDLIILPSSIHEVLLTPYTPEASFDNLSEMVTAINQHEVPAEDQLSNQVYLYTRSDDHIRIVSNAVDLVGVTASGH